MQQVASNQIRLLDCTLRDGGYYNDWDFDLDCVESLIHCLDQSGVTLVEMGYKAPIQDKFYGPYRHCPENHLEFLKRYPKIEFAFMVDTKEFCDVTGKLDLVAAGKCIRPASESLFRWARVATHVDQMSEAIRFVRWLSELGYRTTLNLMGITLLAEERIRECLKSLKGLPLDVFYFADSFGSLSPEEVKEMVALIRSEFPGKIGIHTHDNQGLAYANSLAAIEAGVEYVDGTITGMGRGAGNVRLEQLLLALYFKYGREDLNVYPLLDVIQNHFRPLQESHRWGWDFTYMLSGLLDIHPSYTQRLKLTHQYTMPQLAQILAGIPPGDRKKFNQSALEQTTNRIFRESEHEGDVRSLPVYQAKQADTVLLVGAGAAVERHLSALRHFIQLHCPMVVECNYSGLIDDIPRSMAILNDARLREICSGGIPDTVREVIVARDGLPTSLAISPKFRSLPCRIQSGELNLSEPDKITLPGYVVGMFGSAIALLSRPKRVFLAGFDGFASGVRLDEHAEMQAMWDLVFPGGRHGDTELVSLLPTRYNIPTRSIYGFLQ